MAERPFHRPKCRKELAGLFGEDSIGHEHEAENLFSRRDGNGLGGWVARSFSGRCRGARHQRCGRRPIDHPTGGRTNTISIKDIDCPELTQPYGKQAKRVTTAYVGNRDVVIRGLATDKQGRLSAEVLLQDGRSLGRELLKEGMAWWKRSASADQRLELLEELARAGGKGLWSDPKPVPPWEWKQQAKAKR